MIVIYSYYIAVNTTGEIARNLTSHIARNPATHIAVNKMNKSVSKRPSNGKNEKRTEIRVMKMISWNVNGIRAVLKKNFLDYFHQIDADVFCVQETKCQVGQVEIELPGYKQYWNQAVKKGYSGTAVFSKRAPLSVTYGIGIEEHDREGRVICLEYDNFYLVNVYTPNAQGGLKRLPYREQWEDAFRTYLLELNEKKPVVLCGDLNVAHHEIDLSNPEENRKSPGFSDEERAKMTALLESGFIDSFRHLYPDVKEKYSWWSYRTRARDRNVGWRIDYFVVSDALRDKIGKAEIHDHIHGSDHCPVMLELEL